MIRKLLMTLVMGAGTLLGCAGQPKAGPDGLLAVGTIAPDLSGVDQQGQTHRLAETKGFFTVVYFYPKDQTPGCTTQACAFRDVWKKYEADSIKLFGVSKDSSAAHKKFTEKYTLPFPLIADENQAWGNAFGVSTMLGMYKRVTFLIDKEGRVAKVYESVDPGVNATQIIEDIKGLSQ